MKKLLTLLLLAAGQAVVAQTDTTRVLFIGNSFTNYFDVPSLVKGLADKAGFPFKYTMHAPGGISVGDLSQGTDAHMHNPTVFNLIRQGNWNYVSLQDNQGRFVYGDGTFPDTTVSKVVSGHFKIRDSVRQHNACAHMLWFAGWAFKDGYPGISTTGKGLIENIYENYKYLTDTAGEILSPIGVAWARAIDELPTVDLWGPDEAHQSLAGSYLTASVIFTSIYRMNTETVQYTGGLDSVTAARLRRIAYQTVRDSITSSNLASFIPALTATPTLLTASTGYTSYKWYKNGVLIGTGTANTFVPTGSGCYHVVGLNSAGCAERSEEKCLVTTDVNTITAGKAEVYPNPASDVLHISVPGAQTVQISIVDETGKVHKIASLNGSAFVDIGELPAGLYVVILQTEAGKYYRKVTKL